MSTASAAQNAPAQRVPAWKRLGLKLKGAATGDGPAPCAGNAAGSTGSITPNASRPLSARGLSNDKVNGSAGAGTTSTTGENKRKQPPSYSDTAPKQAGDKRPRWDYTSASAPSREPPSPESRRQKSVTFADGTKEAEEGKSGPIGGAQKSQKNKKKTKKAKPVQSTKPTSIEPSLSYLRQWHTDRGSWKFNKNHQTLLTKYVFDGELVPSSDIATFYKYIRDIKGFVRTRLREAALEITRQDMEQGAKAFPPAVKGAEDKQLEYEKLIAGFLKNEQNGARAVANGRQKRVFDEADFVTRTADLDIKTRALKRMRAEMVLGELSDSDEGSASSGTTTASTSGGREESTAGAPSEKRMKLNDGSQRKVARRRKLRNTVGDDDDDSSSGSDSDSGSSSSSSSSSDGSSDDEEMQQANGQDDLESSSSSSSSSSSESGSDGELESSEEGESEDEVD